MRLSSDTFYREDGTLKLNKVTVFPDFILLLKRLNIFTMKLPDRELLILLPENRFDDIALEKQTTCLHELLDLVENLEHYIPAIEYVNLHRGGISSSPLRIELALRRKVLGPFQFIIHKN